MQVLIWEETENKDTGKKTWQRRFPHKCKDSVNDIKFAPKEHGLILAIAV